MIQNVKKDIKESTKITSLTANPSHRTISTIKDKTKLIICDAAYGVYKGGPLGAPQWKENAIIASTDPVALDYTGMQIINKKRKENDLDPVTEKAIHVKTAQSMGLGTDNPEKIVLIESALA